MFAGPIPPTGRGWITFGAELELELRIGLRGKFFKATTWGTGHFARGFIRPTHNFLSKPKFLLLSMDRPFIHLKQTNLPMGTIGAKPKRTGDSAGGISGEMTHSFPFNPFLFFICPSQLWQKQRHFQMGLGWD
jgi:hypothetical protein